MTKKGLIIGYGMVGNNLDEELSSLKMDIVDKYKGIDTTTQEKYDFAFICVDTPYVDKENPCDVSEVYNAIEENDAEVYILKSTVLPGTVNEIREKTGKRVVFSPEYYGGTQHANNFDFAFTIIGGEKEDCLYVQDILQHVYDARHIFRITDAKTAELTKYMENSWIATKVSFMTQFFEASEKIGVDYEDVRELFLLDPRVNRSHTFVYRDHPYWESHCLSKDVPAIAESLDLDLLQKVIEYNKNTKNAFLNNRDML